jgi:hypothetical protein
MGSFRGFLFMAYLVRERDVREDKWNDMHTVSMFKAA